MVVVVVGMVVVVVGNSSFRLGWFCRVKLCLWLF